MGSTHFSGPLHIGGAQVFPGGGDGYTHLGMSRAYPYNELTSGGRRCRVIYVDSAVDTTHKEYKDGTGNSWRNACSTIQAGLNYARYNHGTTTINYNDDRQVFVVVAPGNYAERLAWSGKNIHLIGLGVPGTDNGVSIEPSAPTTFAFAMSGNGCVVENVCINAGSNAVYGFYAAPMESGIIRNCVIQAAGVASYGIYLATSCLKGMRIENNVINGFKTRGIYAAGGANSYAIEGHIKGNLIDVSTGGTTAIELHSDLVCYAYTIAHNYTGVGYTNSIVVNAGDTGVLVADNWCGSAPSGGTTRDNHYSSAGA